MKDSHELNNRSMHIRIINFETISIQAFLSGDGFSLLFFLSKTFKSQNNDCKMKSNMHQGNLASYVCDA